MCLWGQKKKPNKKKKRVKRKSPWREEAREGIWKAEGEEGVRERCGLVSSSALL